MGSQRSRVMVGSSPAARARRPAEVVSRRVTSSASRTWRNSAWLNLLVFARREAFGERVDELTELETAQRRGQLGVNERV